MQQLSNRLSQLQSLEEKRQIQIEQHRIYNQKQSLYLEELRRIQEAQPRQPTTQAGSVCEQTFFYYARRVMPERGTLARILPLRGSLRSHTGRQALMALETICRHKNSVAYRCGMKPVNEKCVCGTPIQRLWPHRQWTHLYECYKTRLS